MVITAFLPCMRKGRAQNSAYGSIRPIYKSLFEEYPEKQYRPW